MKKQQGSSADIRRANILFENLMVNCKDIIQSSIQLSSHCENIKDNFKSSIKNLNQHQLIDEQVMQTFFNENIDKIQKLSLSMEAIAKNLSSKLDKKQQVYKYGISIFYDNLEIIIQSFQYNYQCLPELIEQFKSIEQKIQSQIDKIPLARCHQFLITQFLTIFNFISQSLQLISKFINIFFSIYQLEATCDLGHRYVSRDILSQTKNKILKLSICFKKVLEHKRGEDKDAFTNWLSKYYPQITYQGIFSIRFHTFPIYYMNKYPCELYLYENVLVIVKSDEDKFEVKSKKIQPKAQEKFQIISIIQIDHSTTVDIVSVNRLDSKGITLHISGGAKSNGAYLQIGAKKACNRISKNSNEDTQISNSIQLWKQKLMHSNTEIVKSILQLKISYQTFILTCLHNNINIEIPTKLRENFQLVNLQQEMSKNSIKPFEKKLSQFDYMMNVQTIPKNKFLSIKVVTIENYSIDQNLEKQYILQLLVRDLRFDPITPIIDRSDLKMEKAISKPSKYYMNYNQKCFSQLVQLSKYEIQQLQSYIGKFYSKLRQSQRNHYFQFKQLFQYKQLFCSFFSDHTQQMNTQIMGITDILNTFFKTELFLCKPEFLCIKLKMSQGLWRLLTKGAELDKIEIKKQYIKKKDIVEEVYVRRIDNKCRCQFCTNTKFSSSSQMIAESCRIFNQLLDIKSSYFSRKNGKQFCFQYATELELRYLKDQELLYHSKIPQKLFKKFLQEYQTKINYRNYNFIEGEINLKKLPLRVTQCNTKTIEKHSLMVALYSLPNINYYYNELKETEEQSQFILNQFVYEIPIVHENQGYKIFKLVDISKQTTCRQVKLLIGKHIGMSEEYLMNYMQSFSLVLIEIKCQQMLVQNREKKENIFGSLFRKKQQKYNFNRIIQKYNLYDHENVFDSMQDLLKKEENKRKYMIGLKKKYKNEPLILEESDFQKGDAEKQNYQQFLQLEIAEIWYKLNNQMIQLVYQEMIFLENYISKMIGYLHKKWKIEGFSNPKDKQHINERILVRTGIFSKSLFRHYYNSNKQENIKRRQSIKLISNKYIFQAKSTIHWANNLIKLTYQYTDWPYHRIQLFHCKNSNDNEVVYCQLYIESTYIFCIEGQSSRKAQVSMAKSKIRSLQILEALPEQHVLFESGYETLDVENFGEFVIIQIHGKNRPTYLHKLIIMQPFAALQLLIWYKLYRLKYNTEDMFKSKLKEKFDKEKESKVQSNETTKRKSIIDRILSNGIKRTSQNMKFQQQWLKPKASNIPNQNIV